MNDIRITIGFTVTLQDNLDMWHPVVLPKLNQCYSFLSTRLFNKTKKIDKTSGPQYSRNFDLIT